MTRLTGLILIVLPLAFNTLFLLLQRTFEYPDILQKSPDYVLRRFAQGGRRLIAIWYGFMLSAVLAAPLAVMVHVVLDGDRLPYLRVGTVIGVLAGIVQFLGLARWPFLVPYLARTYTDKTSSQATRDTAAVVFQSFNRYAGAAVGEHLGYLFTSVWTATVAVAMMASPLFNPWLGWIGLVPAVGIFVGLLEAAGWKPAGAVNAISYVLWSIWLLAAGVFLLVS